MFLYKLSWVLLVCTSWCSCHCLSACCQSEKQWHRRRREANIINNNSSRLASVVCKHIPHSFIQLLLLQQRIVLWTVRLCVVSCCWSFDDMRIQHDEWKLLATIRPKINAKSIAFSLSYCCFYCYLLLWEVDLIRLLVFHHIFIWLTISYGRD